MTPRERKREQLRAWRARNKDRVREHNRTQAKRHAESIREYKRRWREDRLEELRAAARARYAHDPARVKGRARRWNQAHPGVVNALTAKRRAAIERRTPPRLTTEHLAEIRELYLLAAKKTRAEGAVYHVDHIVPLQGRCVSGLHVPWNLRVVSANENAAKSNKWNS